MEKQIQIITALLKEILDKLTIEGEIEYLESGIDPIFTIRTREAGLLIGEDGKHLIALSHLIKKMAENKLRQENLEKVFFLIDVNDYQLKKVEELRNIARMSAQRAMFFKREMEMDPMSSYERRIVHSVLGEYPDIKTESAGEEPYRRVIIKPIS